MYTLILMALSFIAGLIMMYKWHPKRHMMSVSIDNDSQEDNTDYYATMNVVMSAAAWAYKMRDQNLHMKWLSFINEAGLEEIYGVGYTKENRFGKIREFDHFTWQALDGEREIIQEPVKAIKKMEVTYKPQQNEPQPPW